MDIKRSPGRPKKSLIGIRFGRLVVTEDLDDSMLLCRCDCGNEIKAHRSNLLAKRTQSCGCLHDELASERLKEVWNLGEERDEIQ